MSFKLGFIGAGNMAGAIISSVVKNNLYYPEDISICEKNEVKRAEYANRGFSTVENEAELVRRSNFVFIAVKPADLREVLEKIAPHITINNVIVSIVAGASIGTLVAVASALGVHMTDLFEHDEAPPSPLRRFADQVRAETAAGVFRRVAHHDAAKGVEMVVNEYAPGTASMAVHLALIELGARLQFIESGIESDYLIVILAVTAIIAVHLRALCKFLIICYNSASIPAAAKILRRIKGKTADISKGTCLFSVIGYAM